MGMLGNVVGLFATRALLAAAKRAKDPEMRAALERLLKEMPKTPSRAAIAGMPAAAVSDKEAAMTPSASGIAEQLSLARGERWSPPVPFSGPVLAVHLDRPNRVMPESREAGVTDRLVETEMPKPDL